MAKAELNVAALYAALDAQRNENGMNWKELAAEVGVNASTLTRMAQGKRPDVDGLASLLEWLDMDIKDFVRSERRTESFTSQNTMAMVTALLRSDASLSADSAKALESVLKASYDALRNRDQE